MSEQDRDYLAKGNEDPEAEAEDVEAHVKHGRDANDEPTDGEDDVEAHVKHGRD
jgi:hypothetical protein